MAAERRTAMMCSEALWWHCHRRPVADRLLAAGDSVWHTGSDGRDTEHQLTSFATVDAGGPITYSSALGHVPGGNTLWIAGNARGRFSSHAERQLARARARWMGKGKVIAHDGFATAPRWMRAPMGIGRKSVIMDLGDRTEVRHPHTERRLRL